MAVKDGEAVVVDGAGTGVGEVEGKVHPLVHFGRQERIRGVPGGTTNGRGKRRMSSMYLHHSLPLQLLVLVVLTHTYTNIQNKYTYTQRL